MEFNISSLPQKLQENSQKPFQHNEMWVDWNYAAPYPPNYSSSVWFIMYTEHNSAHIYPTVQSIWTFFECLPIGVRIAVHEPTAVVVNVHSPRLVILPKHHVLDNVNSSNSKGRIWMIIITVYMQFPVVDSLWESRCAQNNTVIIATAGSSLVVIGQNYISMGWRGIKCKPGHCRKGK